MSTELKKHEEHAPQATTTAYRRPYYAVNGNKEAYTVDVYMPGVAKSDYKVSLQRGELLVEGHKAVPLPTGARWLHREINTDSYKLRLQLNVDVDESEISAKGDEGILRIHLPVAKEARPRMIRIS